jgi:hypothetical protein
MKKCFCFSVLFGWLLLAGAAPAQEGNEEGVRLTRELAAEMIAIADRVRKTEVTVGPMIPVDENFGNGLTATGGICVSFIAPKFKEGRRVRIAQKRVIYFDEEWGWYMYSVENLRGGQGFDIVTQDKKRIVLR